MTYTHIFTSPLGPLVLRSDGSALTGLSFLREELPAIERDPDNSTPPLSIFVETERWLRLYFSGKDPGFLPPLKPQGTTFRMAVWDILLTIPYGQTMTYGDIARQLMKEQGLQHMSAQAVGGAVGHNPIGILIPCHRVMGTGGNLTGYADGLDKKIGLLELQGHDVNLFTLPRSKH